MKIKNNLKKFIRKISYSNSKFELIKHESNLYHAMTYIKGTDTSNIIKCEHCKSIVGYSSDETYTKKNYVLYFRR